MVHGKQNSLDVKNSPLRDDNLLGTTIVPIELEGQETFIGEVHYSNLQAHPLQLVVTT
jgi:hypothetical protein